MRYPPAYPVVLAGAIAVADAVGAPEGVGISVVSAALFAAATALFAALAHRLAGARTAVLATAVWLLWPTTVGMAVLRSSEVLFLLPTFAGLLLALAALHDRTPAVRQALVVGAVLGLGALVRPIGVTVVLAVGVTLVWARPDVALRRRLGLAAAVLVGTALIVLPWSIAASLAEDSVVVLSTGTVPTIADGLTFGVDPTEEMGSVPLTDGMRDLMLDARQADLHDVGGLASFIGDQVQERPVAVVTLVSYKTIRAWYGTESLRYEWVLAVAALVLLSTSSVGLVRWWCDPHHRPDVKLIVVTVGLSWVAVVVLTSLVRYLAPVLGLLLVPAVDLVVNRRTGPRPDTPSG